MGRRFNHNWRITVPDLRSARQEMNFFQRTWFKIQRFFQETIGELRKVSWPTRREAIRMTWIVIGVILVMAVILGGLDFIYSKIFSVILG
jgi:preprotein translocase subunit SecE